MGIFLKTPIVESMCSGVKETNNLRSNKPHIFPIPLDNENKPIIFDIPLDNGNKPFKFDVPLDNENKPVIFEIPLDNGNIKEDPIEDPYA